MGDSITCDGDIDTPYNCYQCFDAVAGKYFWGGSCKAKKLARVDMVPGKCGLEYTCVTKDIGTCPYNNYCPDNAKRTFIVGPKGSGGCSEGTQIADEKTCREACTFLNLPLGQILGNYKCYKDGQGNCYQNGRQGPEASMICKASEKFSGTESQLLQAKPKWRKNCNSRFECGRGTRTGGRKCDRNISHKDKPDFCGQCKYGWRNVGRDHDWCCREEEVHKGLICKCEAEYAPNCPPASSTSELPTETRVTGSTRASIFGCKGNKIALKTQNSRYILVTNDNRFINATGNTSRQLNTQFEVIDLGSGRISLKSYYGSYLAASVPKQVSYPPYKVYGVHVVGYNRDFGAVFHVKQYGNTDQYVFETAWKEYLKVNADGSLMADGSINDILARFKPERI